MNAYEIELIIEQARSYIINADNMQEAENKASALAAEALKDDRDGNYVNTHNAYVTSIRRINRPKEIR